MEILVRGTTLDTDEIQAPGARPGSSIIIERGLGECPHGFWYEARQDETPLLVTVLDPILVAQPDLRAQLVRNIERGRHARHRNLLPCYGVGTAGVRVLTAEAWPGGGTVREFARERRERGHALDAEGAYTLVAHVCNGLVALHEQLVHGYVTADTVHVSEEGRVLLGAIGVGASLPRTRGFSRFRFGGLLPNIAPEQVLSPPQLSMPTDVFGTAALFIELITGQSMVEAGQPLSDLGVRASKQLTRCLARATDPEPDRRQPDIAEFKAELAQALRSEGVRTVTRPPGELDAAFRNAMAEALASSSPDDDDPMADWGELGGVPEHAAPMEIPGAPGMASMGETGLPPPPRFTGVPEDTHPPDPKHTPPLGATAAGPPGDADPPPRDTPPPR
ncbi:MAG: protein kinase [Myxococcota bacterium]